MHDCCMSKTNAGSKRYCVTLNVWLGPERRIEMPSQGVSITLTLHNYDHFESMNQKELYHHQIFGRL
jgi:hypothetical protein